MITFLAKLFIPGYDRPTDAGVRRRYGILCSVVGIGLNIILFGIKFLAGTLSGSISITADAFNNLSDAGSSLITLVGFKFAGAKPDPEHPFGHGRIEYISGFAVSLAILLMGFELGKSSFEKILHPEPVETGLLSVLILVIAIAVKLYMFLYNRSIGKKINSAGMAATAADSLSDSVATTVVLISSVIAHFTHWQIDGWCGMAVSLFILYAGYNAAKDMLSPLLGQAPDPAFVRRIETIVLAHPEIISIHDLVVHDYGPGRVMVSLHGEVNGEGNIYELHNVIDNAEGELMKELGCEAVIHMDPIDIHTPLVKEARLMAFRAVAAVSPELTAHDFRMVPGPEHTNLIFDVVVPQKFEKTDEQIIEAISGLIAGQNPSYRCVIKLDRNYTAL